MAALNEDIERFKASFETWAALKSLAQANRVLAIAILSLAKDDPSEALEDIKAFQKELAEADRHMERLFEAHESLFRAD